MSLVTDALLDSTVPCRHARIDEGNDRHRSHGAVGHGAERADVGTLPGIPALQLAPPLPLTETMLRSGRQQVADQDVDCRRTARY